MSFADPSRSVYLVLIVAVIIAAMVGLKQQSRRSLIATAVCALLLIGVTVADHLLESPREEATRRIEAMVQAANDRSPERFVEHVSGAFNSKGVQRDKLRTAGFWELSKQHDIRVAVWDFRRDDVTEDDDVGIEFGFRANGRSGDGGKYVETYARARFIKDPDGQWRLRTIKFFNPVNVTQEESIPGFP